MNATMSRHRATISEVTRLEQAVQKRWFDLAMAEDRGLGAHVLERMFAKYLAALDALVAAQHTGPQEAENVA